MIAALQKHSGRGAAETGESNAQEGDEKREGLDSQRGSILHSPMLDAVEEPGQGVLTDNVSAHD
jgi:hypothetical protein